MTGHALQRLSERFPGCDPAGALQEIRDQVHRNKAFHVAYGVTGADVYAVHLPAARRFVFPVIDGETVVTVLREGMEIQTPEGVEVLQIPHVSSGIHLDMPDDLYHSDPSELPSLSSTLAKLILAQSPLHGWTAHPRLNPDWHPTSKRAFDFGRVAHRFVLGRGGEYDVYPESVLSKNGAASTAAAKDWEAACRSNNITPMKSEDADRAAEMAQVASGKMTENGITIERNRTEIAVFDQIGDCFVRAMIDYAPSDPAQPLYDFKTCEIASPDACMRAIMNYGYDVQAFHYLDTWAKATGEERRFRFIFQEKTPPFEVCVVELHPDTLTMASKRVKRAREIWGNCVNSGHWPGYPRGVHAIDLPEFYQAKWLERESAEADHKRRTGADVLDAARRWQSPEGLTAAQ